MSRLHFMVVNGTLVASSPSFFGSNPAEVRDGPKKGLRILAAEEDSARALFVALDAGTAEAGADQCRSAWRHRDDEQGRRSIRCHRPASPPARWTRSSAIC